MAFAYIIVTFLVRNIKFNKKGGYMLITRQVAFVVFLVIALVVASTGHVFANPITDTFTDTSGQTYTDANCTLVNVNPGNFNVVDEHGGAGGLDFPAVWEDSSEDVGLTFAYGACSDTALKITLWNTTHTSANPHTMWNTMLAFEQNAVDWKGNVLLADSWDGTDGSNDAAVYFGHIQPNQTVTRYISLKDGYVAQDLFYDSLGLDSGIESPGVSNVSITHSPEPVSSVLFITGAATLGFRRFRKKRRNIY